MAEVPKKRLILRCCLIHLKKSSICQRAVELGHREGGQREVVGEHDHVLARLGVPRSHTPELVRVRLGRLRDGEPDRLVADESGRAVDGPGVESAALEGPNHEGGAMLAQAMESGEVDVAAVQHVDRAGLGE